MCANNPPMQGPYAGNDKAVEVILAQQQNALLASIDLLNVTIVTRGVALAFVVLDEACMLSLNPTASQAILIQGNSIINMPGCSIVSDSTNANAIYLQGTAATVTADAFAARGGRNRGNPTLT
jgi:hypothetical protein